MTDFSAKHPQDHQISIHIFAWRRERSLKRLLDSLIKATYNDYHHVPLFLHIDGDPMAEVVEAAHAFAWPHGPKVVEVREERVGMPKAIVSGWNPRSPDEYAILLEDDVEVSPYFFQWTLYGISLQRAIDEGGGDDGGSGLMGISLYTPKVDEIGPAPNAWSPPPWSPSKVLGKTAAGPLFFFQLPCSWGAVYRASYWLEFLRYFGLRYGQPGFPETPSSRSNEWFDSWKRILIELMLMKGWYLVYPNFPSSASFSTNYFELGVHSVPEGKEPVFSNQIRLKGDRRFTVPLIKDASWRKRLEPISSRMISQIPWVNLQHRRVNSRQDLFVPKTVFMRNHLSSELQEYLAQL